MDLEFDWKYMMRLGRRRGNVLKLDGHKYVKSPTTGSGS